MNLRSKKWEERLKWQEKSSYIPQREEKPHKVRNIIIVIIVLLVIISGLPLKIYNHFLSESHQKIREYIAKETEFIHLAENYIGLEVQDYDESNRNDFGDLVRESKGWYDKSRKMEVPKKFEKHNVVLTDMMYQYYVLADAMDSSSSVHEVENIVHKINDLIDKRNSYIMNALEDRRISYTVHADGSFEYETHFKNEREKEKWDEHLETFEWYRDLNGL